MKLAAFLQVAFILKIIHFFDILSQIEGYLSLEDLEQNLFALLKMILRIFFLAHFFACIWHFIGEISLVTNESYGVNWITTRGLANSSV